MPRAARSHSASEGNEPAARSRAIPVETRIEAADALGQAGDPRLEPGHPERYVAIPAGSFLMGAQAADPSRPNHDPEAYGDEGPVSVVTLSAYRIGRYPVTVTEYRCFLETGGYADPRYWTAGGHGRRQAPQHWEEQLQFPNRPVAGVSWYEALAYCRWAGASMTSPATCWNGRGACGESTGMRLISGIRMLRAMGVRTWKRPRTLSASCGAAGSSRLLPGASVVPFDTGTSPSTASGSSVFGWSCAHDPGR